MSEQIFRQIPLYRFIKLCNEEQFEGERRVLDCGGDSNKREKNTRKNLSRT